MQITRRHLLGSGAAALAAAALPARGSAATSLTLGGVQIDTLSDGHLVLPADFALGDLDPEKAEPVLRQFGLGTVQRLADRLAATAGRLDANSPIGLLSRGYSVTRRADTGVTVRSSQQAPAGTMILTRLAAGTLRSRVEASWSEAERD